MEWDIESRERCTKLGKVGRLNMLMNHPDVGPVSLENSTFQWVTFAFLWGWSSEGHRLEKIPTLISHPAIISWMTGSRKTPIPFDWELGKGRRRWWWWVNVGPIVQYFPLCPLRCPTSWSEIVNSSQRSQWSPISSSPPRMPRSYWGNWTLSSTPGRWSSNRNCNNLPLRVMVSFFYSPPPYNVLVLLRFEKRRTPVIRGSNQFIWN